MQQNRPLSKELVLMKAFRAYVLSHSLAGWLIEVWSGAVVLRFLNQVVSIIPTQNLYPEAFFKKLDEITKKAHYRLDMHVKWIEIVKDHYILAGTLPEKSVELWLKKIRLEDEK